MGRVLTIAAACVAILSCRTASAQELSITFLHTPPKRILEGQALTVSGNIVGADQVSIAALNFRWSGEEAYEVRELQLVKGDRYQGVIPAEFLKAPAIEYYCYAIDFEGNKHLIFATEDKPHQVLVVTREQVAAEKAAIEGKKPPKTKRQKSRDREQARIRRQEDRLVTVASATRVDAARAPGLIAVVTREEIDASGARTLADLLDRLPGMTVSRDVAGGFRLTLRGMSSDPAVLVMLDGLVLRDPYAGATLLEFPAEAVERIEVLRGPGATLHGDGAFGGVVHVVTRDQGTHGRVAYGGFNTVRVSAGAHHHADTFSVGGQVQFAYSEGQSREVTSDVLTGVQISGDDLEQDLSDTPGPVDDQSTLLHGQLHTSLKSLGGGELGLNAHYLFQGRGALVGKLDTLDTGSEQARHVILADLGYNLPVADWLSLDVRAFFDTHVAEHAYQVLHESTTNGYRTRVDGVDVQLKDGMREVTSYQSMSVGADVAATFRPGGDNELVTGIRFLYLSLGSFELTRDIGTVSCSADGTIRVRGFDLPCEVLEPAAAGTDRLAFSFYVHDRWANLFEGFDLIGGFRLDYFSDVGLALAPRGGIVYSPTEGLWLKALYAMAFRTPTFRELYEDGTFDPLMGTRGNEGLVPVLSHTVEVGAEALLEPEPLEVRLRADFFYTVVEDGIGPGSRDGDTAPFENNISFRILGTELEAVVFIAPRTRLFVNGSWFRTEVESALQAESSYITDVPQLRFNLGADLALFEWLNLHVGVRYGSERRNNVHGELEQLKAFRIPATTLVRVGLTTEPLLFDHLVLFAHAYNVFDHDMRDPPPHPERLPGLIPRAPFTFLAGLAWRP